MRCASRLPGSFENPTKTCSPWPCSLWSISTLKDSTLYCYSIRLGLNFQTCRGLTSLGHFPQNSLSNLRTETSCVIDAGEVGTYRSSPVSPKRAAEPHFPHVSGISTQSLSGLQKNGRRGLEWMVRSPGRIFNAEAERILNKVQYFKIQNIGYPRM